MAQPVDTVADNAKREDVDALRAKVRNDGYAMELVKMYAITKRLIEERIDELKEEDDE